jgi:NitT/TauT family transport system permease protein
MFAATICFFPVTIAVIVGLQTVDSNAQTLLTSLGASRWQSYRKLAFPASLPIVFAGLKTAVTLALIGAIVGEFVGGNKGLGVLINQFNYQLSISDSFAVILALAIFGLLIYGVIEVVDRKVAFWRGRA